MPIEEKMHISAHFREVLEREAKRRGVDPAVLAGELIDTELACRTKPKKTRGVIAPFRKG
jgi:hypothetical protein